eukprot:10729443-Prorocentrum_lima.AAC.1
MSCAAHESPSGFRLEDKQEALAKSMSRRPSFGTVQRSGIHKTTTQAAARQLMHSRAGDAVAQDLRYRPAVEDV